jgi:hypothetical protein
MPDLFIEKACQCISSANLSAHANFSYHHIMLFLFLILPFPAAGTGLPSGYERV